MGKSLLDPPNEILLAIDKHPELERKTALAFAKTCQRLFHLFPFFYTEPRVWRPHRRNYTNDDDDNAEERLQADEIRRCRERIFALMACPTMAERRKVVELEPVLCFEDRPEDPRATIHLASFEQTYDEAIEQRRVIELEAELTLWHQAVQNSDTFPAFDSKTLKKSMDTAIFVLTCCSAVEYLLISLQGDGVPEHDYIYTPFRYALLHPGYFVKLKHLVLDCSGVFHFERIRPTFALPSLVELHLYGLVVAKAEHLQNLQVSKIRGLIVENCCLTRDVWKLVFQHLPDLQSFWWCRTINHRLWRPKEDLYSSELSKYEQSLLEYCGNSLLSLTIEDYFDPPESSFVDFSKLENLKVMQSIFRNWPKA